MCAALFTALSVTNLNAGSNDIAFRQISLAQGLSQSTVQSLFKDSMGFMWVGTADGLNRYDGESFVVYRHDPEDPGSLSNSNITALYEDSDGALWIGANGGGLNRFNRNTGTFERWRNQPDNPESISNDNVTTLLEDRQGNFWVGTGNGLNLMDREQGTFTRITIDQEVEEGPGNFGISTLYEDTQNRFWIGSFNQGLYLYDRETKTARNWRNDPDDPTDISSNNISDIIESASGEFWIGAGGNGGGLHLFHEDLDTFTQWQRDPDDPTSISNNAITDMSLSPDGDLWISTFGGGINRFDTLTRKFSQWQNDPANPKSLSDNTVVAIFVDELGIVWIGTRGGGIHQIAPQQPVFDNITHDANNNNSLSNSIVWAVTEDANGLVWIGTSDGGINRVNRETDVYSQWVADQDDPTSITNNTIWALHEDRQGDMWIGTRGTGLSRLDENRQQIEHWIPRTESARGLTNGLIRDIYEDSAGELWILTNGGGLFRFDRAGQSFENWRADPDDAHSLSSNFLTGVAEDASGRLWISTNGAGMNMFNRERTQFSNWINAPDDPTSIPNDNLNTVYINTSGIVWLGAYGGGLIRFDPQRNSFSQYREKDGLSNDVVYGILEDGAGSLWLSTNQGITRFNPVTETFRVYTTLDGMQSNEFNSGAFFKNAQGEMYFGGVDGITIFHPDSIVDLVTHLPVVITAVKKFDRTMMLDVCENDQIEVTYKDKYLTFEYAALNYLNPHRNQYAYMLEGFDDSWVMAGDRRFATYTNLSPGAYTFRVRSTNHQQYWGRDSGAIAVVVTPPFWQTWWFILLSICAGLGIALGVHRRRVAHIQQQKVMLEQQVEIKTREIRETQAQLLQSEKLADLGQLTAGLTHEINTPAGVVKSNLDILLRCVNRLEEMIPRSESIGDLLESPEYRRVVKMLRENGHISAQANERIARIIASLKSFARLDESHFSRADIHEGLDSTLTLMQHEISEEIQVVKEFGDIPNIYCYPSELNQVFMGILRNAVEAIAQQGIIRIITQASNGSVCVRFIDSGRGIPAEKMDDIFNFKFTTKSNRVGFGMGLFNARTIVRKHNGDIHVKSEVGKGTELMIELPVHQA
jgi:ligand-binding sensor domain-containing protein/signal transduction histidine kinase